MSLLCKKIEELFILNKLNVERNFPAPSKHLVGHCRKKQRSEKDRKEEAINFLNFFRGSKQSLLKLNVIVFVQLSKQNWIQFKLKRNISNSFYY